MKNVPAKKRAPKIVFPKTSIPKKAGKKIKDVVVVEKKSFAESEPEPQSHKLTVKQELFCTLYATAREFFGNGVQAYIEAYDVDVSRPGAYASARTHASELLTNRNILKRIDELLELGPLNDTVADRKLAFWMEQQAHPTVAMDAIKEYNKLKQRIVDKAEVLNRNLILGVVKHIYDAPPTSSEHEHNPSLDLLGE